GKNAAFAVSLFRTVFYSTLYRDAGSPSFLAQGKAILVSHRDQSRVEKRGVGYWGSSDFKAVADPASLPDWLRRQEMGTTVASLGFLHESGWEWQMTESLVRNFFAAILEGTVSFSVEVESGVPIEITRDSLPALFENAAVLKAAEDTGSSADLSFAFAL